MTIAYVIMQPGTTDVLLDDGSWGEEAVYWERAAVFLSRVAAQRRAARYLNVGLDAAVCPWEIPDEPERI